MARSLAIISIFIVEWEIQMPKVNPVDLKRWRELNLIDVLDALTDYAKQDSTFHPIGNPDTFDDTLKIINSE